MATLWQFFGFPDPEGNTNKMPQPPQESVIEAESVESEVASLEEITNAPHSGTSAIPRGWTGPLTPDGEPFHDMDAYTPCLLYTSPSPRDMRRSRMPSSA